MLVSAGETHRCNSHGNTGSTVDRVSNDKKHGGRWWQASFHVRFTRGFMTLAPSHAVVRCKPTFQPAVHLSTVLRESFFHPFRLPGPRYSSRLFSWQTTFPPPANLPRKLWCKTLFRFLPIKKKCLARVILSQNNLLLPPTQFDSNCKHRRHYFDSYLNLHFTWQTKIKQWNNSFNRGNFLLWIDFDWQDLDFLMEYLHYQHFITVYINILFSNFYFCVFFWYGEFSCIENCSKSPWKINGGNIKKRSVW